MSRVDEIFTRAKNTVAENEKLTHLLHEVTEKLGSITKDQSRLKQLVEYIQLLIRMVRYHMAGRYRSFSTKTILMFVFGLVYFLTPIDVIPDFIPILGFTDDLSIVYYIFKNFAEDITAFRNWEQGVGQQP